ncbi:hypothetical protein XELAEV_18019334mg [Xenopus laevis]|uniref:LRRCT domain-containing protein n=1 Tax=Xenopus laevis TaxID=8355 RepID=A0A974DHJ9_XENLA|nr:hypothetical protein XELAEV_18019334mg [Xenopus laevis]
MRSLFLLVLSLLVSRRACSPSCTTEKNVVKGKQETQCTHMGLTSIPLTDIPSNTAILVLKFNDIKSITTSTFKGLPLLELDLSNNAMTSIKVDSALRLEELNLANNSFDHIPNLSLLTNLKKLILSNNQIISIDDTAFHSLQNLQELYLQHNQIDYLSEQLFERTQQLHTLDLSYNKLVSVPRHLISSTEILDKFYLTGNRLTEIPDNFFEGLDNLAYVYLDDNPFQCNCALENFKSWLEDNSFNIYTMKDGDTTQDEFSVVCTSPYQVPLLKFPMDHCRNIGDLEFTMHPFSYMDSVTTLDATGSTPITTEFQKYTQMKTSSSSWACSNLCTTEKNVVKDKQETQCTHMGLTSVPMTCIPSNTSILILKFNDLKSVNTSTFKSLPLLELDLSNNAMTSITVDLPLGLEELNLANNSFDHIPDLSMLTNLNKLILSYNNITSVPNTAFHELQNLHQLYLQHNRIDYLSEQVFNHSQQLHTLDLSYNKLVSVPRHLISQAEKLDKFYLTGNRLTEIPEDFFKGLKNLAYVYLDDNPFQCNCTLENFKIWVEDNSYNIYIMKDGATTQDEYSVACASPYKVSLLDFSMDHCSTEPNLTDKPITTTPKVTRYVQTTQKTTTVLATTLGPTTELQTSTQEETPTTRSTQTPTVQTIPLTDLPLMTTLASEPSTTIEAQTTLKAETSAITNATSTVKPTWPAVEEHSTSTNHSDVQVPAAPMGIGQFHSWLEETIVRYCCLLHLLLYLSAILLVLLQVVVLGVWLAWACNTYYKHYHTLVDKPPSIWLLRARGRKEEIQQPHVAAQGPKYTGNTSMRVFEADYRDQRNKFASAIL